MNDDVNVLLKSYLNMSCGSSVEHVKPILCLKTATLYELKKSRCETVKIS